MYNIDNLIKVVEEAKENIDNTIKKTDAIKKSIDDINQEKYEKVKRWMLDIKDVSKKIGYTTVFIKLPPINWVNNNLVYKYHNAAKICINAYGAIELGFYIMRPEYKPTKENWRNHKIWSQWIRCAAAHQDFTNKENGYVRNFCKELVNNWDLYEKECYENLKDWALEAMAEKAKEANDKYSEAVNKYQEV